MQTAAWHSASREVRSERPRGRVGQLVGLWRTVTLGIGFLCGMMHER